jgi:hypothetical protein
MVRSIAGNPSLRFRDLVRKFASKDNDIEPADVADALCYLVHRNVVGLNKGFGLYVKQ